MNNHNNTIQHTTLLVKDLAQLLKKSDKADVTFLVENKRIQAHRMILAARSEYFKALLYGALLESTQDEIRLDVPLAAFECLLQYIYTGSLSLEHMGQEDLMQIIILADQYGFIELKDAIALCACKKIRLNNVCIFLRWSSLFDMGVLYRACLEYMDRHAAHVILHDSFPTLTYELLKVLLDRKSFVISEVEKFQAIHKWSVKQLSSTVDLKNLYQKVAFPLMSYKQLFYIVRPTGVLQPDELLDVIAVKERAEMMPSRCIGLSTYKREIVKRNNVMRYATKKV